MFCENCSIKKRLLITAVWIFLLEMVISYVEQQIEIPVSQMIWDALEITIIVLPVLYFQFIRPLVAQVTEREMAEAWKRRPAVRADCSTLTTTGMLAAVPNWALSICTSCRADVATPLVI